MEINTIYLISLMKNRIPPLSLLNAMSLKRKQVLRTLTE